MALWTDIIDPATLTGYARASAEEYERNRGSLSSFLPNETINDIVARVVAGDNGLVEAAKFRSYDAEIEFGASPGGSRKVIELPALGQQIPVSEYDQLRLRNASDDEILQSIQKTTDTVVSAVADRMEYMRGVVITTGAATIDQDNFKASDDFGRDADMDVTAGTLWSADGADPLSDLQAYVDAYIAKNGEAPGTLLASNQVLRALAAADGFRIDLNGGGSRPGSSNDINGILDSYQIPNIVTYNRKVRVRGPERDAQPANVNVLPADRLFLLPAQGKSNLGASYWGRTLTSTEYSWGLAGADQSGIVAGVYRNEKPPVIAQVIADAIGLPILANANLAFTAKVL